MIIMMISKITIGSERLKCSQLLMLMLNEIVNLNELGSTLCDCFYGIKKESRQVIDCQVFISNKIDCGIILLLSSKDVFLS